jgi:hypothetical protein
MARHGPADTILSALVDQLAQLEAADVFVIANIEVALALEPMVAVATEMKPPFLFNYFLGRLRWTPPRAGRITAEEVAPDPLERIHEIVRR